MSRTRFRGRRRGRDPGKGGRQATGFGLIVFFLAVAAAPHRHLNGLEDLLFDQPSDSGVVAVETSFTTSGSPSWNSFALVEDNPCPACFGNDFVSAPTQTLRFMPHLAQVALRTEFAPGVDVPLLWREALSRAPPDLS